MPTYDAEDRFRKDWNRLTPAQRERFLIAMRKFVHDLRQGQFRESLRVKPFRRRPGVWEMTWADDGRALFRYGEEVRPGHAHVIWMRVGSHDIFDDV